MFRYLVFSPIIAVVFIAARVFTRAPAVSRAETCWLVPYV